MFLVIDMIRRTSRTHSHFPNNNLGDSVSRQTLSSHIILILNIVDPTRIGIQSIISFNDGLK